MNTLNVQFVPDAAVALRMAARERILHFESLLSALPGTTFGDSPECPLEHTFCDGIYVRKIFIPAGKVLTGKIHRHAHPNFLVSGSVEMFTEQEGLRVIHGPLFMISLPDTKRVLRAITDLVWITVHRTDALTPEEAEKEIIVPSYEEFEREQLCLGY